MAQLQLHKLLSHHALRLLREDSFEAAKRSLDAAWRLRQASGRDPILLGQLVAMAQARYEMLALRTSCHADERWQLRLRELEFESPVLLAMQTEAWPVSNLVRRDLTADLKPEGASWFNVLSRRFSVTGYGEAIQHSVERLREQDPRTFSNETFFEEEKSRIPRWNFIPRILLPNLFDSWQRAVRVELEAELTLAILEERGREHLRSSGQIASSAVPGASWRAERTAESVHFRFEDRIPEPLGRNLALDYSVSPAGCTLSPAHR